MAAPRRELLFLEDPDDLDGDEEPLADAVADRIVDLVNEERRRLGLPPLERR